MQIGILSDTHGLLRPEVLTALAGSSHILHAGDVGDPKILETLRTLAPTTAIRGNIDPPGLPETEAIELHGHLFYLVHALTALDLDPAAARIACVLTGHTHKPLIDHRNGVLYLNPGSAGPRRFRLPVTVARITITGATLHPEILPILP